MRQRLSLTAYVCIVLSAGVVIWVLWTVASVPASPPTTFTLRQFRDERAFRAFEVLGIRYGLNCSSSMCGVWVSPQDARRAHAVMRLVGVEPWKP